MQRPSQEMWIGSYSINHQASPTEDCMKHYVTNMITCVSLPYNKHPLSVTFMMMKSDVMAPETCRVAINRTQGYYSINSISSCFTLYVFVLRVIYRILYISVLR